MAARGGGTGWRYAMWLGVPAVVLSVLLAGCSDPAPGLTADEFYARAAETRERALGAGLNGWDAFAGVLEDHRSLIKASSDAHWEEDVDAWPVTQISDISVGSFPREGLEGGLALLVQFEENGLFERLEAALDAPLVAPIWDTTKPVYADIGAGMTHLGQSRSLGRTLRAHARVAAIGGDDARFLRVFETQLAIGNAVANRCLSIDYLVGVATVTMALQDARHLALEEALSPAMIRGLLELFDAEPILPPLDAVLETERDFSLATFVDSAMEQGISVNRRAWIEAIESAHAWAVAQITDEDRGFTADMDSTEFFATVLAGDGDEEEQLGMLRHGFAMVLDNERRLRFDIAGTRAVLLVALHRAEHGVYPKTLNEVDAPLDPIARVPFAYRLTPDDPDAPFLLYSVGIDQTDNNGLEREPGAFSVPSPDDTGFDCRVTKPRRPHVGFME